MVEGEIEMDIQFMFAKRIEYSGTLPEDHMRDYVRSALASNPDSGWDEFPERDVSEESDEEFLERVGVWFSDNSGVLDLFPDMRWSTTWEMQGDAEFEGEDVAEG